MEESPFETNQKILYWVALWRPRQRSLLYWAFYWFSFVFVVLHVSSEVVAIFVFRQDLQLLATIICIVLTGCNAFIKLSYFMYKSFQDLLLRLETIMHKYSHQKEEESITIMRDGIKRSKLVSLRYAGMWTAATITWMVMPVLYGDPTSPYERPIPLLACFPFDISVTPYYEIAYGFQIISSYSAVSIVAATDAVCISVFIQVAAQLNIVNCSFRSIVTRAKQNSFHHRDHASVPVEKENVSVRNGAIQHTFKDGDHHLDKTKSLDLVSNAVNEKSYELMVECVQHHQEIVRFVQQMETLFSPLIFYQCVSSTFIICFVTFLAASSSLGVMSLFKCTAYLAVATFQIWLYCTYGDDIMSESLQVGDAAFSSDWIGTSTKLKRSLMMIIAMGRRPLCVKAFQFYVLSLETFASLLNASYTYFTLLQQLNKKRVG